MARGVLRCYPLPHVSRSTKSGEDIMAKAKKAPKRKARGIEDLPPKSPSNVRGGRQSTKTDFGTVLGQGVSKAADVAITPPSS